MPRKSEGSKAELCRKFLEKNPLATFKDFEAAHPKAEVGASYFATLKSNLKKKADGKEGVKKTPPPLKGKAAAEPEPKKTNGRRGRPKKTSSLDDKIETMKGFLAWLEDGKEKGYIEKLKEHL